MTSFFKSAALFVVVCAVVQGNRYQNQNQNQNHKYTNNHYQAAASQQVPQVATGYKYPVPQGAATAYGPPTIVKPGGPVPIHNSNSASSSSASAQPVVIPVSTSNVNQQSQTAVVGTSTQGSVSGERIDAAAATNAEGRQLHVHHMAQLQKIDVACGKDKMTVRVNFDQAFNGVIYAKGHYNDPNCRFVNQNSGQRMYQFEMSVGNCGVAFIDSGLTSGGQAYVEGLLVIILESGVQEAWDAARRIRCLWEGSIDQTVTFPLSVNMLDSQTLTFSGDTASASLEIQTGRGPRAPNVQGLVRIGDLLTAVVTVVGDNDFDLLVRNCVATDGTPNNRVILSDNQGCATKPKLMGGWVKQRNPGNILAYAYLSAFKFPDLMDLFLECTVSLCKGACAECSQFEELHVPNHGSEANPITTSAGGSIDVRIRNKRNADLAAAYNSTTPEDSLRLRRVVHVVSPDDFPEFVTQVASPAVYGGSQADCFSLVTIMAAVFVALLLVLTTAVVINIFRRSPNHGNENPMKFYSSGHRP